MSLRALVAVQCVTAAAMSTLVTGAVLASFGASWAFVDVPAADNDSTLLLQGGVLALCFTALAVACAARYFLRKERPARVSRWTFVLCSSGLIAAAAMAAVGIGRFGAAAATRQLANAFDTESLNMPASSGIGFIALSLVLMTLIGIVTGVAGHSSATPTEAKQPRVNA